jgi:hypothetical protein
MLMAGCSRQEMPITLSPEEQLQKSVRNFGSNGSAFIVSYIMTLVFLPIGGAEPIRTWPAFLRSSGALMVWKQFAMNSHFMHA